MSANEQRFLAKSASWKLTIMTPKIHGVSNRSNVFGIPYFYMQYYKVEIIRRSTIGNIYFHLFYVKKIIEILGYFS